MAGEVLNMNDLDINKHWCKLKVLCFKNRHKTIYQTLPTRRNKHCQVKNIMTIEKILN